MYQYLGEWEILQVLLLHLLFYTSYNLNLIESCSIYSPAFPLSPCLSLSSATLLPSSSSPPPPPALDSWLQHLNGTCAPPGLIRGSCVIIRYLTRTQQPRRGDASSNVPAVLLLLSRASAGEEDDIAVFVVRLFRCLSATLCLFVCLFLVCLFPCLCVSLFLCLFVCLSLSLFVCFAVCFCFICFSVFFFLCFFLFVCFSFFVTKTGFLCSHHIYTRPVKLIILCENE